MRNFYLLTKDNCPLCTMAKQLIQRMALQQPVALHEVDIASQAELLEEYGNLVPVLVREHDDAELKWPFGDDKLRNFLEQ
ncbi:thioredoxin family protein [Aliidiomarina taiwanensis]|uniref:Thioredoxin family protein n=1 Tax=Aliidiomarina taiwanensis TaxID=946228 RepID=A0A432X9W2_9GAMM|nr:glutaredoxin family protein [Aliidiomarina taiwanensis]RUO44149.1 thioredoxin family protein [Aliidiomarina taiwanensis]